MQEIWKIVQVKRIIWLEWYYSGRGGDHRRRYCAKCAYLIGLWKEYTHKKKDERLRELVRKLGDERARHNTTQQGVMRGGPIKVKLKRRWGVRRCWIDGAECKWTEGFQSSTCDSVNNPKQTYLFKRPHSKFIFHTTPLIWRNKPLSSTVMTGRPQWAILPGPGEMCGEE